MYLKLWSEGLIIIVYKKDDIYLPDNYYYSNFKKYLMSYLAETRNHIGNLFDKLISPILNYGSEIWGFNTGSDIKGSC